MVATFCGSLNSYVETWVDADRETMLIRVGCEVTFTFRRPGGDGANPVKQWAISLTVSDPSRQNRALSSHRDFAQAGNTRSG